MVHRGLGIARPRGKVVFIPAVIPGETVSVEITEEKASYSHARLIKVIDPSPDRITPECPYFPECGGCQFAHIEYRRQLDLKRTALLETMLRVAKFDPGMSLENVIAADSHLRYRSRVRLHVSAGAVGFKSFRGDRLVEIDNCLLARDEIRASMPALKKLLGGLSLQKDFEVELDLEPGSGKVYALLHAKKNIVYYFERGRFAPAALSRREMLRLKSFAQPNPGQNKKLAALAAGLVNAQKAQSGLELFTGSGNLSFGLASNLKKLVCVELNKNAVELARITAKEKGAANLEFFGQASESYLQSAVKNRLRFDLVILDPPRTGAKKESEKIVKLSPEKIIYISCEPSTLARDLKIFIDSGYRLEKMIPIDMFPQTYHIETVSLLSKT